MQNDPIAHFLDLLVLSLPVVFVVGIIWIFVDELIDKYLKRKRSEHQKK